MDFYNNKDRGSIKWTALMLPEHVKEIREWYESDNDIQEPEYDEYSLNALAEDLNIAYKAKSNVRILYWINKRLESYEGQIIELFPNEQAMKIRTEDNVTKLKLKYIIKVYM